VHLHVAPDRIVGRFARAWPSGQRAEASAPVSIAATAAPFDEAPLDAVLQELALAGSLRGACCSVELADPFVHFDVAEGDFAALRDRELQAIATACIGELLGDAADDHEVRWSLQSGQRHLLIAALPRTLIAPVVAATARHGARLAHVQPAFVRQWNAHARTPTAATSVFAALSGGHVVLACIVDGAIRGISVGPWARHPVPARQPTAGGARATEPQAESGALLDERAARLVASLGVDPASVAEFVLVAGDAAAIAASPRWTVRPADTEQP